jgi:hypothetical protein
VEIGDWRLRNAECTDAGRTDWMDGFGRAGSARTVAETGRDAKDTSRQSRNQIVHSPPLEPKIEDEDEDEK